MRYLLVSTDWSPYWDSEEEYLTYPTEVHIGKNRVIRHPTVIYENVTIGDNLETGHFVMIREGTRIGDNCRIGSYSELDGDLSIGNNFQCHSRCHISKYVRIGDRVRFMFNVTTLNDMYPPHGHYDAPQFGDDILVASHVKFMPGARVESNSFIPANTIVKGTWKSNWKTYERLLRRQR